MRIVIEEYNPEWPRLYEQEQKKISLSCKAIIKGIEHIGSTSIPGLGAKPIIDIMVGVDEYTTVQECIDSLVELGYQALGEFGIPGRLFFKKLGPQPYHLHVVEIDGLFWQRQLQFRNYLRSHPDEAKQYYELKKRLSELEWERSSDYAIAKTDFVESILKKAEQAVEQ